MAEARYGSTAGRREDEPLLAGRGRFTDDVASDGAAHAVFVRAAVAHARVAGIDAESARGMPGVLAVVTGADLAADGIGGIPTARPVDGRDGRPMVAAAMPVLARDQIRFVGQALAVVVAETLAQALDAAERVEVDAEALPAATDAATAIETVPGALVLDWARGDRAAVDAAFARAAHVVRVRLDDPRVAPTAMEPRAAIGSWDPATGRYTLIAGTQGVAVVRRTLAEHVFKVPRETIRVVTPDVGGGFGMKAQTYPEYAAVLYAARKIGRPVRWTATRLESFLADTHGRDGTLEGALALDSAGRFLALDAASLVGIGAYVSAVAPTFATANTAACLSSVYRIPAIHVGIRLALTNAAPLGPYRGAGRPEAIYLVERLIDAAARETGIDRVTLRRRNLIRPSDLPYATPNGPVYDSGDFEAVLDKAIGLADWAGFPARRDAAAARGRLRGIGLCCFLEVAGGWLDESADLRFEADGTVALRLGAQAMGQGHLSTFPALVAGRLGIPLDRIRLVQGDSDEVPDGTPSVASRSTMMAGSATVTACDEAVEKGRRLAAHLMEAAVEDVELRDGDFVIAGTDRRIGLLAVAQRAREGAGLPAELSGGLDTVAGFVSPQMTFPNGCHVCEAEIDPETGTVAVVAYTAVDDVGTILQPTIVEGQIHGGVAQGVGQVLGERVVYDTDGQLVTGSFMDYPMPRADSLPALTVGHHVAPATTNPLGVKGAGESGVAGSLPATMAAVLDALSGRGIDAFDMPATPERVWAALRDAASGAGRGTPG